MIWPSLNGGGSNRCCQTSRAGWSGLAKEIHALTDDDGLPVKIVITPGQTHDILAAAEQLANIRKEQIQHGIGDPRSCPQNPRNQPRAAASSATD